uniref:Uncharacterized protein n=1 Tax=Romanomermis culicivorax TaxID=13658 RepID=A0A915HPZ2_ROMCU
LVKEISEKIENGKKREDRNTGKKTGSSSLTTITSKGLLESRGGPMFQDNLWILAGQFQGTNLGRHGKDQSIT